MALNTEHNVTLTEGQIGTILCSLEKSVKYADSDYISKNNVSKLDPDLPKELDNIFEELEGVVDTYYNKIEKAKSKQPTPDW